MNLAVHGNDRMLVVLGFNPTLTAKVIPWQY